MVFNALYKYPANLYLFLYLSNCFYCKKKKIECKFHIQIKVYENCTG